MKKEGKKSRTAGVQPLADRVLIREIRETEAEKMTKSGIIIPPSANEDKETRRGEVVAVGPGRYEEAKLLPMSIKVGDVVLFSWGDKVKIDGEEYYIIRESEIIAVIK